MGDWIDSPERAIGIARDKVSLAQAVDVSKVQLEAIDLAKVLDELDRARDKDPQLATAEQAVVEAAVVFRQAESQAWIQGEVGSEVQAAAAKHARAQAYIRLSSVTETLIALRKEGEGEGE